MAGCDDDDDGASPGGGGGLHAGGTPAQAAPSGSAGAGVVSVAANTELGRILVGGDGRTLYSFEKDKAGKPACYGACAGVWPPYTTERAPKARNGAEASMLDTTQRTDGERQVTYNGFPLYTYVGDKKPGNLSGNDFEQFGAEWYAVTPAGEKPDD